MGQELAGEWKTILDDFFSVGSKDFLMGLILWQETARQAQEMLQKFHIKLFFNSAAASWFSQALEVTA